MQSPNEVQECLNKYAASLHLQHPDIASLLNDLGKAVTDTSTADGWAFIGDITTVLDISTIVSQLPQISILSIRVRLYESIRNVFIFLPLLITWLGIGIAVNLSRGMLGPNNTFLSLWQDGFNNKTWFTLDVMAFIDFVVLLAVAVFTIFVQYYNGRKEDAFEQVASELTSAFCSANLVLSLVRSRQPINFVDTFKSTAYALMTELNSERERIATLAAKREKWDCPDFVDTEIRLWCPNDKKKIHAGI